MKYIDLQTWPRRKHFQVYNAFDYPHFNLCANVDVTELIPAVKQRGLSFTAAVVYILSRVANEMPEFRLRIRGQQVVEREIVHPSPTILSQGDLFSFCTIPYTADFQSFAARAAEMVAHVQSNLILEDEPGQDDLLFMTGIPWVSFTSFMHPIHLNPIDSVPRMAWGKFFEEHGSHKMPLSVQVHHALMDGLHVGRYYQQVQHYLDSATELFN
jgi:chloramphenicol O-acetyltransferase type A